MKKSARTCIQRYVNFRCRNPIVGYLLRELDSGKKLTAGDLVKKAPGLPGVDITIRNRFNKLKERKTNTSAPPSLPPPPFLPLLPLPPPPLSSFPFNLPSAPPASNQFFPSQLPPPPPSRFRFLTQLTNFRG